MTRSKKSMILKRKKGGRRGGGTKKRGGYRLFGSHVPGTSYDPVTDPEPLRDPNAKSWFNSLNLFGSRQQQPQPMSLSAPVQQDGVVPGTNIYAPSARTSFMQTAQQNPYDYGNNIDPSSLSGLGNGGDNRYGVSRTDSQVGETMGVNPNGIPYKGMGGSRRRPRSRLRRR
jgi:hypothetical protein